MTDTDESACAKDTVRCPRVRLMKLVSDEGNAFSNISNEASEVFTGAKKQVSVSPTRQWLKLSSET